MCELMTALTIASSAIGAVGAIQQGNAQAAAMQAQANAATYNAQVADMNAKIEDRRARDALERGQEEEQRLRLQAAQLQGRQRAAMAANGVDLGFGSPLDTILDTAVMAERDALRVRRAAANEAYDFDMRATNMRADANLGRMNAASSRAGASAARTAGYLNAAGTVLGGAGDAVRYNRMYG